MTEKQKQTVGLAIASLVLGILGLLTIGPMGSIPAVICGHIGLSKIKKNPEELEGGGLALAGLIMGYLQIGFMLLLLPLIAAIAIPIFVTARDKAEEISCTHNIRMIDTAKQQWAMETGLPMGSTVDTNEVNERTGFPDPLACPSDGIYEYNPIGEPATCSVHQRLLLKQE